MASLVAAQEVERTYVDPSTHPCDHMSADEKFADWGDESDVASTAAPGYASGAQTPCGSPKWSCTESPYDEEAADGYETDPDDAGGLWHRGAFPTSPVAMAQVVPFGWGSGMHVECMNMATNARSFMRVPQNRVTRPFAVTNEASFRKTVVERAISDIKVVMDDPTYDGFARIKGWHWQYEKRLGSLKQFLQSHPTEFKIVGCGKGHGWKAFPAGRDDASRVIRNPKNQKIAKNVQRRQQEKLNEMPASLCVSRSTTQTPALQTQAGKLREPVGRSWHEMADEDDEWQQ